MDYKILVKSSEVVMVEFFATWCPHCQRMMPVVEQVKELVDGKAKIYQLDIDKNQESADAAGVNSVPTFIFYKNGEEVKRLQGETEGQNLLNEIESLL